VNYFKQKGALNKQFINVEKDEAIMLNGMYKYMGVSKVK